MQCPNNPLVLLAPNFPSPRPTMASNDVSRTNKKTCDASVTRDTLHRDCSGYRMRGSVQACRVV